MQPSPDLYRRLVDSSRDGLWLLDGLGRTLFANDRMAELLGRTPEEMATLSAADVHDEQGRLQFEQHLAEMRAGHPGQDNLETRYQRSDGTAVWLLVSWHPVRDDDGEVVGWLHRYTEYTERRRLLDALREREKLLATAQSIAQVGAWEWIVESNEVIWSEQLYRIYNVSPEEFTATYEGFLEFVHPDDRPIVTAAVGSIFEGAEEFEWDARVVRRGGEIRWVRGLGRAERDADGRPVRMAGTAQDITERVLADQEVAEATRRLALLRQVAEAANESTSLIETLMRAAAAVDSTPGWEPMCVFVRDGDGPLAALELADGTAPDLPEPDQDLAEQAWQARTMTFRPAPGRETTHSVIAVPVTAGDAVACVIELLADENPPDAHSRDLITQISAQLSRVAERERAASVLAEARDQAMEASRLKSEFLATMSHEIRTPMNGVIGLADLLLQTDLDAQQRRQAEALHGAGLTLLGIINDILDVSKIEAGKLELEIADFDVVTVLERTTDLLSGPAADKGLELTVTHDPEMPRWLSGDAGRVGQVLANLGANAVKFTDRGEVRIVASTLPAPGGRVTLRVAVSDTGPGIAPDLQERLFEPFVQLDPSSTRRHGGTGLGLTIVQQLTRALGGEITVDSEVGRGTTFVFSAPFEVGAAPGETGGRQVRTVRPVLDPVRTVLVVEDNQINQLVATGLLENAGYRAEVAEDGEVAVAALTGDHGYAAVLMDIQMPRMDGFAATRAIRAQERPGERVPIIAMTASALEGERERCLEAGMDDFLSKPVDIAQVERVVRQWVNGSGPAATAYRRSEVDDESVLDPERVEMLAEMVKDGESLFRRSSGNFLAGVPASLDSIQAAVDSRDARLLTETAHKFKGSALNLGLQRVGDVAQELETAGSTADFSTTDDALRRLRLEVDRGCSALARERSRRI